LRSDVFCGAEMNRKTEYIRDAILQTVQAEQSLRLGLVAVEQKINIGRRSVVTTGDGTEQVQVQNASGLQVRLMLAKDPEDALLVHSLMVTGVQVCDKGSEVGAFQRGVCRAIPPDLFPRDSISIKPSSMFNLPSSISAYSGVEGTFTGITSGDVWPS